MDAEGIARWTGLCYRVRSRLTYGCGAVRCGAVRGVGAVRVFGRCLHSGVDDGSGRKRTRVSEEEFGQFVEVGVLESYLRTNKRHGRTGRWRLGVVARPEHARMREGRNAAETQQRRGDVVIGDGEVDVDVEEVVVGEALAATLVRLPRDPASYLLPTVGTLVERTKRLFGAGRRGAGGLALPRPHSTIGLSLLRDSAPHR